MEADARPARPLDVGSAPRTAREAELLRALRSGDEQAYADVVARWSTSMLRLARTYVSSEATAQDVVQETWLAVLRGLDGFEGRSSLRTWVYRILVTTAKSRGVRDSRVVPVGSITDEEGPTVDPSRFEGPGPWHRHWTDDGAPRPWRGDPAQGALRAETRRLLEDALADLPARQRAVVVLRDVEGLASDEVCDLLGLSPENQRVLLHRGRARVRAALEGYLGEDEEVAG
jgi:RNA polymerase sigma-70 factor (ECF subfamily)